MCFSSKGPLHQRLLNLGVVGVLVVASQQIERLIKLAGCLQLKGRVDLVTNVASTMLSLKP